MKFKYTHKAAKQLVALESVQEFLGMLKSKKSVKSKYFKKFNNRSGSATVFVDKKNKVVIKLGGTYNLDYVPKRAIPTAYHCAHDDDDKTIRIQPLAERSTKTKRQAHKLFCDLHYTEVGDDLHYGNVGKYNGKFVVIDW